MIESSSIVTLGNRSTYTLASGGEPGALSVVDLFLAFEEVLTLQSIAALVARDSRFRVASQLSDALPMDPIVAHRNGGCVALIDGRRPPQRLATALAQCTLTGCVFLTERHPAASGSFRLPLAPRQTCVPWAAPWEAVADALLSTHASGRAEAPTSSVTPKRRCWSEEQALLQQLTVRERQVMVLIAEGYSVREIAKRLRLAESTIDNHKSRLMKKIGARKSVDVVRFACRVGVATP